jgi:hypothetical protein
MTNGYVKVPEGKELEVKRDIQQKFKRTVFIDHGVLAKVKVKLIPIHDIIKDTTQHQGFTHAYTVRIRA